MKTIMKALASIALLTSLAQLTGCATAGKNTIPQGGDMTMAQIYRQETGLAMPGSGGNNKAPSLTVARKKAETIGVKNSAYVGYTAGSVNQVNNLFKQLPNPVIAIYIFPHLVRQSGDANPVPGYTTAFNLYKQNHFAMPSEKY